MKRRLMTFPTKTTNTSLPGSAVFLRRLPTIRQQLTLLTSKGCRGQSVPGSKAVIRGTSNLRDLRRHLRVSNPLFTVKVLQHLNGGAHVGCQLKHADSLGEPHRRVGVPERVRNSNAPARTVQYARLIQHLSEAPLEVEIGFPSGWQNTCSSRGTAPALFSRL